MSLEEHEAIVVGAIGTVFDVLRAADPLFGSRLRPCRRRLVSGDSSPLMVRGELDMFFRAYDVTWY